MTKVYELLELLEPFSQIKKKNCKSYVVLFLDPHNIQNVLSQTPQRHTWYSNRCFRWRSCNNIFIELFVKLYIKWRTLNCCYFRSKVVTRLLHSLQFLSTIEVAITTLLYIVPHRVAHCIISLEIFLDKIPTKFNRHYWRKYV